jgi:hypothetical protein
MKIPYYTVISRCEDELNFDILSKDQLLKRLKEEFAEGYEFLDDLHTHNLEEFPSMSVMIIEGGIVVPKVKKVAVEFEL